MVIYSELVSISLGAKLGELEALNEAIVGNLLPEVNPCSATGCCRSHYSGV
jgi:hypothetical protein